MKRISRLVRLDPMLDGGVLRVAGRLSRTSMPGEANHPGILAKDFHISGLILRHVHLQTGNGCFQSPARDIGFLVQVLQ